QIDTILRRNIDVRVIKRLQILIQGAKAQENVGKLYSIVEKLGYTETDLILEVHLYCFIYLIEIEGVYDQNLRFLYAHHKGIENTEAELKDIRTYFLNEGLGKSLFECWDPTVRNAIAHA